MRHIRTAVLSAGVFFAAGALAQDAPHLRDVVLVGSNWDGTAEIFDPHTFKVLKRINIVPDRAERMQEIENAGLRRRVTFHAIRSIIGEGHDQLVDDLFPSADGRFIYASRPSFADVVAIDVNTGAIAWRTAVAGSYLQPRNMRQDWNDILKLFHAAAHRQGFVDKDEENQ